MLNLKNIVNISTLSSQIPDEDEEIHIILGTSELRPDRLIEFMNIWCQRIDNLIEADVYINGDHTQMSHELINVRGFTWAEYLSLFHADIGPSEYINYPVFFALDVQTKLKRDNFKSSHATTEDKYLAVIKSEFPIIIKTFFEEDAN